MQAVRWSGFWSSSVAMIVVLTTLAVLPSFGAGAVPSGPNPPLGVHLSYLDDPTQATVTWYTASASTSRAEWGPSLGPPYPASAAGIDYTSPGGSFLHTVNLTGLTPGARYYYRVGNAGMNSIFGQVSFRAAPPSGASDTFTFAAAGDWGNTDQTRTTSNGIAVRNPNFVLPLGDLYYAAVESGVKGTYDKWQIFGQGSFIQDASGNHEVDEAGADNTPTMVHCAFSTLPGNERTYAFTWGNTFFVTMDWGGSTTDQNDGVDGTPGACTGVVGTTAIRAWVDAQLAAANADPTIRWIIVYFHFPCYDVTTTPFPLVCPTQGGKDQIEDILMNRHVDVVLSGHDHTYGRTHPVRSKIVAQTGSAYDTPGAPIYLIIGTGGKSGGTPGCRPDAWVAACSGSRGFGWFQVSDTKIRYEFVNNSGGFVDAFSLTKSPSAGFVLSTDPSAIHVQPGNTGASTASVIGVSAAPVTLTLTGCPPLSTCTASPPTGNPRFTSNLAVATSSTTPEGNYRIIVTASNGTASTAAPWDVTVARQISKTYQKGDGGPYSETDDAYIYNGSVNTNFGTASSLFIDAKGCVMGTSLFACKSLLKFPLLVGPNEGQVAQGGRVTSATLQMWVTNTGPTEDIVQLLEAWEESTVTWNSVSTPGFPRVADPVFVFKPTAMGFISINVTFIVQKWADGDPNQGFFLTSTSEDGVTYDSSESSTLVHRPKLIVTFEKPIGPIRDPLLWPFTSDSVWNLPIGGSAVYVPGAIARSVAYGMTTDPDVLILNPGRPITPVYLNSDQWTGRSRCDIQGGVLFEAPIPVGFVVPGADPTSTPNHAAAILDADGRTLIQGQPYTHCTAKGPVTQWWFQTSEQLDGRGVSGGHGGSKLSSIGGTIRLGELVPGGLIRHSMKVLLDAQANLYFDASTGGFRWPATAADLCASTCYGGQNPSLRMGALLALPTSIDVDGMGLETEAAKILARGFQDYGAYVVDNTAWSVYGIAVEFSPSGSVEQEFASRWGFSMTPASKDVPWARDMDRIFGSLAVVDNWNEPTWQTVSASNGALGAGLGAPRIAWAPPLGVTPSPVPFDFSLTTSPSSGFVAVHGGSVSATVTAQRTFGPSHSVQYSCTNLPTGSACTFTPASGNPTSTANLVLATSSGTPAGTYAVNLQATDGTITRTAGFVLTIGDPLLAYDMETLTADGKMKDLSGNGNHGTITGTTDAAGQVGRARSFNGTSDKIVAPSFAGFGGAGSKLTIAAWVNPTSYAARRAVFGQGGNGILLDFGTDGRLNFWANVGNPQTDSDGVAPSGSFTHIAVTYDDSTGTVRFYFNGVLTNTRTISANQMVSTTGISIGTWLNTRWFLGTIDEARVYNRVLTGGEIASLVPPPSPSSAPVLAYDMETLTADGKMKDLSGNGNHGTITGTTDAAGQVGRARSFNGTSDKIVAPSFAGFGGAGSKLTIAAWVNPTSLATERAIVGQGWGGLLLDIEPSGRLNFWANVNNPQQDTDRTIPTGTFTHVAVTYDDSTGTLRFYINGVLVNTRSLTPNQMVSTTGISIGTWLNTRWFLGTIDEIYLYTRALTGEEIASLTARSEPASILTSQRALLSPFGLNDLSFPPEALALVTSSLPKVIEFQRASWKPSERCH